MPKISVILCAFNAEDTLSAAVRSVLLQTQSDFELIIVNDGSRDKTQAVASQFCLEDPRVRLVNIENGGLSNARNVGMSLAKGEFVAFCDADDTIDQTAFETMLKAIETDGTDMVMCGYFHDTQKADGTVSSIEVSVPCAVYHSREELFNGIVGLKSKFIFDASWNKLFRRTVIAENGLEMQVGELFEDTAFVLSFLECSAKVSVLSDCFYHYVQRNNGSITKKYDPRKLNDLKKRHSQLAKFCIEADPDVKRFVDLYYIKNVYSALANSYDCTELSKKTRKQLFCEEILNETFKTCAKTAKGVGLSDKLTVTVARLGWLWLNRAYCRAIHFMKRRAATLFAKIK